MRVLMIAPQPFFEPRGTPISVFQRLHGLSSLGHEVDLVTYSVGKDVDIPNVNIYRTPALPFVRTIRIGPSWAKVPLDIMLFFLTVRMLLRNRYDVIHSHEEASFFAVFLAKIFRTPHLYDMHSSLPKQLTNFNFFSYRPVIGLFKLLETWVLRSCNVVLTIGADLEAYVLDVNRHANHIRIENIAVHNQSVHDHEAGSKLKQTLGLDGKLPIVYTGTFERYQGFDLLFESIRIVTQTYPEICLVMVGGRPEQIAHWQNEVKQLGISDSVIFVGTVPLEESLQYLEMGEILVSPRTTGLSVPLKIYSYLHSGKPTVATNIYAHTQIMDEETAVITEPEPEAYADGIMRLIADPGFRAQIGEQAKTFAGQEFSRESYLTKLARSYLAIKLSKRISEVPHAEVNRRVRAAI